MVRITAGLVALSAVGVLFDRYLKLFGTPNRRF